MFPYLASLVFRKTTLVANFLMFCKYENGILFSQQQAEEAPKAVKQRKKPKKRRNTEPTVVEKQLIQHRKNGHVQCLKWTSMSKGNLNEFPVSILWQEKAFVLEQRHAVS